MSVLLGLETPISVFIFFALVFYFDMPNKRQHSMSMQSRESTEDMTCSSFVGPGNLDSLFIRHAYFAMSSAGKTNIWSGGGSS